MTYLNLEPGHAKKLATVLRKVVMKRATKPIFQCARLTWDADAGGAWLDGTDLEWAGRVDLTPAMTHASMGAAEIVVDLDDLLKLLATKAETVRLAPATSTSTVDAVDLLATWTTCRGVAGRRLLEGAKPADYPCAQPWDDVTWTQVDGLGETLAAAAKFAGKEAARFVLNGLRLTAGEVVATDGRTLYLRKLPDLPDLGIVSVLPVNGKAGASIDGAGAIAGNDRASFFRGAGFRLACRRMEGTFPNYGQIVPAENGRPYPVDVDGWLDALAIVEASTCPESPAVKVEYDVTRSEMRFEARNGSSTSTATVHDPAGVEVPAAPLVAGFNPAYLRMCLADRPRHFRATMTRHKTDTKPRCSSAARFDGGDTGAITVVMPVLLD